MSAADLLDNHPGAWELFGEAEEVFSQPDAFKACDQCRGKAPAFIGLARLYRAWKEDRRRLRG